MSEKKRKPLHEWTEEEYHEINTRDDATAALLKIAVQLSRFAGREVPESHINAKLYELLQELHAARFSTGAAWRKKTYAG